MQYMSLSSHPSTSTWTVVCVMWKRRLRSSTTARRTCWPSRTLCSATMMWQRHAATDHPDGQVVRVQHAGDALDCGDDRRHVGSDGRAFEKHSRALAQDAVA